MDFNQLRMFCAVAEQGSIVKAAKLLHRVPSNLTTRLHQLEQDIGAPLFIREKQRIRLSDNGYQFLPHARAMLELRDTAYQLFQQQQPNGLLQLGSLESLAASKLPALLAAYHQRYPMVTLALSTETSGKILQQLRQGTITAALIDEPTDCSGLRTVPVYNDQLVLVSSLRQKNITDISQVQNAVFFAFDTSCSYRQRLDSWFLSYKLAPPTVMALNSYHAMIACVAGGGGLALVPQSLLQVMPEANQIQAHCIATEMMSFTVSLLWREENQSINIQALAQMLPMIDTSQQK
jgi:DNA-binding transcriptional LysR family regulator